MARLHLRSICDERADDELVYWYYLRLARSGSRDQVAEQLPIVAGHNHRP